MRLEDYMLKYFKLANKYGLYLSDISENNEHIVANDIINSIIIEYNKSYRLYHNETHVFDVVENIIKLSEMMLLDEKETCVNVLSAIYQDIVFDSKRADNRQKSAFMFECHWLEYSEDCYLISDVVDLIIGTSIFENTESLLNQANLRFLTNNMTHSKIEEYERSIFKEYQHVPYSEYKIKRINILNKIYLKYNHNNIIRNNILNIINYIENRIVRVGVYCGSFNPLNNRHMDIIEQADKLFDKVIIAKVEKSNEFSDSIVNFDWMDNVKNEVIFYSGFTATFIESLESYYDVTLIREMRYGFDLGYEIKQIQYMLEMKPDLKHIMILASCDKSH